MPKKNGNSPLPQVTSGRDWRRTREEGVLLQLPSGKVGRFRPVDFSLIVRLGKVPDSLTSIVIEAFQGENVSLTVETMEDVKQYVELADAVTACAFVQPKIVDNPTKDDEISLEDVEQQDREYLLILLNQSAKDLESFRHQENESVEPVRDIDGDGQAAQPDHEPTAVGDG